MTARVILSVRCVVLLLVLCTIGTYAQKHQPKPFKDDPRVDFLLGKLTLEEKIALLGGTGFETTPIPRVGIPALNMTDGPVGVRWKSTSAFPVSIMMAAGWDPDLIERLGSALGQEAKAQGRRMLLGPCVNIHRTPFGGRNFESFGEDPYLAAHMAASYVKGVQKEHVVATVKHYACNNQETERDFTNVTVGERALREIYLPAFEAAVKEGRSLSVMSAYNKVNGKWCSENPYLLTTILKDEWGFKGFVVSDWGAVHSTVPTANAGLDVEMPTGAHLRADSLLPAINRGEVAVSTIDEKVRRLLRVMVWAGLFDHTANDKGALDTPEHRALALDVAREGIVLLKNERGVLPLHRDVIKSIAVIGPNAAVARTGGGGSSHVDPLYSVSTLDGLKKKLGNSLTVRYAIGCRSAGDLIPVETEALAPAEGSVEKQGLKGEYFANTTLSGPPVLTRVDKQICFDWGDGSPSPALPADSFSVRWTGTITAPKDGPYSFRVISDDGVRLYLNGNVIINDWVDHAVVPRDTTIEMKAGVPVAIRLEYYENTGAASIKLGWGSLSEELQNEAVLAAKQSDVAVVCVGSTDFEETEGLDRATLALPRGQAELVNAIAAANRNTVVVLTGGAPVLMRDWIDNVPVLLETWFPGEEGGNAIADILLGDVNPSGRLPMTFLKRWEDAPAYGNFPGKGAVDYAEGIFVGYRHFDRKDLDVEFPFGHGLSYTTFAYTKLKVSPFSKADSCNVQVSVEIKNTGSCEGAEVVQLYVHDATSAVERAPKELKAFRRIQLRPGDWKVVTFSLDTRSFAWYDPSQKEWKVEPGRYEILVGSSSRDIRARGSVEIR